MIKFTILQGQLQIKWQDLTVPLFNEIYQADTSKNKAWAFAVLKTIFHLADRSEDNGYRDRPYYSKFADCVKAGFGKAKELTDEEKYYIEAGVDVYTELNETTDSRTLDTFDITIEKIRVLIDKNEPEIIRYEEKPTPGTYPVEDELGNPLAPPPGKVSWVTNTPMLNRLLKDLEKVAEARDKLRLRLSKDANAGDRNKGKYEKSASEKGVISAPGQAEKLTNGPR